MRPLDRVLPGFVTLFAVLLAGLTGAAAARGDGFIVISNPPPGTMPVPPGHFTFAPLEVSFHHVTVDVRDQVAVTSVDQEFVNPNSQQLEGTYLFPLPAGAHIDKFSMDINGRMQEAELLPADKARSIYEDIVRRHRDPALLEYIGRDTFKVRIFPIEANGKKRVKIQYTQLLKSDTGLVEYTYPLNTEKFSARPLREVSVKVNLETTDALKSVYCPTHNVEVKRDGTSKALVGYEEKNVRPDTDFKVVFSREAKNDVGISLMTYRNAPDDGYFVLLASPGVAAKNAKPQPKDLCLVLDTSGSMAGKKMEQAKKALAFCLANLNEADRFDVVRFSTEAEDLFEALEPASKENVAKAQAYVEALKPIGGTAIDEALQKSLKLGRERSEKEKRPYVVVFLTDGQPTIGETREDAILANVSKANTEGVRIFSFGIGTELNTHLLDRLAEATRSVSQYVIPTEDIEVKLSNFYTKIKDPALTGVSVTFTGADIKTREVYPGSMPDLFQGEMLVAFGRYGGKGAAAVKVAGTINGERKEFVQDVTFADLDTKHEFIPRLWATRRVGWLLDEIRRNGETAELKNEVVRLARAHGIVTPYTAYLILEDEARRGVPIATRTMRELEQDALARDAARAVYDLTANEARNPRLRAGDVAVANATNLDQLKSSSNMQQSAQEFGLDKKGSFAAGRMAGGGAAGPTDPQWAAGGLSSANAPPALRPAQPGTESLELAKAQNGSLTLRGAKQLGEQAATQAQAQGYRFSSNYAQQARVVRGRTFYQNGTTWTDAEAATKTDWKHRQVAFNSDEYFALLQQHPEAAAWLSLGNEVDLVLGDTLVSVR